MNKLIVFLFFSLLSTGAQAQTNWTLKKEQHGIQVYTANSDNSAYKSVRVVCTVKARPSQVIALLLDINKLPRWVYSTKESHLVKLVKPNELLTYSRVDVPWPCDDRDYVSHLTIAQPSANTVTIESHAEPNAVPLNSGVVRVQKSTAHWEITSLPGGVSKIEYTLSFDPAGAVPAWLTNMFVTKGPMETFTNLVASVDKPEYKDRHFDFIRE